MAAPSIYTEAQTKTGGGWTPVGPYHVDDVAYAPDDPQRMYAVSNYDFLRSDDGWETWTTVTVNLQRRHAAKRLHVASASVFYVAMGSGGGIYRSTDSGASWAAINTGLTDTFITALISAPADPLVLYAAANGGDIFRYDNDDNDEGRWTLLVGQEQSPFSAVGQLSMDNTEPPALLAATPEGLFRSEDGIQWRLLSEDVCDPRVNVYDLTVTGDSDGALWIATGTGGVLSRSVGAEGDVIPPWMTRNSGLEGERVITLAVDPQKPTTVYAGTETNLFKSEDGGLSWQVSDQGLEPPPLPTPDRATAEATGLSITALAIDPTDSERVYAGTSQSLFISTNGGESWTANTDFADIPNWPLYPTIRQIAIAPGDPATIYTVVQLADQEAQVFKSVDSGEHWTIPAIGGAAIPAPFWLAVDPLDADVIYGTSRQEYSGGVWKSEDGGHIWQIISSTLSGFTGSYLAISGQDAPIIVAAGTQRYGSEGGSQPAIYLTRDGGERWHPISGGLGDTPVTSLAFDPARPSRLYAGMAETGVMEADFARQQRFLPIAFSR